jgi:hypothetical protein
MAYRPLLSHLPTEDEISSYKPMYGDLPTEDEISAAFPEYQHPSASQMLLGQVENHHPRERNILDEIVAPEAQQDVRNIAGLGAGFLVPELRVPGVSQAITKGINQLSPMSKMLATYLRNIGKGGAGGAAANVILSDEEDDLINKAAKGGRIGEIASAVLQPLSAVMPGANPLIRGLIGSGLGYLGGSEIGQMTGHPGLGEAAGIVGGGLLGLRGGRGLNTIATKNLLSDVNPEQVLAREAQAKEIGVPLTMTEAIGSPVAGKQMASLYNEPSSALKLYEFGEKRKPLEEKSINNLMNQISPKDAYVNIEKPLYDKALQHDVPMDKFAEIVKDPYMKKQMDKIISDPLYSEELKSANPNSIKVLDLLKRSLDSEMENSTKSEGRLIGSKLSKLKNIMDKISPDYKLARQVSEKRITRENLENRMNDSELSGSNFYSKFLKNNDEYKKLYFSLRNSKKPNVQSVAQKKLEAMKTTFPLLIDPMNAKIASTIADSKIPVFGKFVDTLKDSVLNLLFKQYNKSITDIITSDRFDKQFEKLYKIKNKEKRAKDLANILSRSATLGITQYGEQSNK